MSPDRLRLPSLVLAALAMALIAGFFYAYACSVMLGLARLGDAEFIRAMQAINATVRNGVFAFSFFGAAAFTLVALLAHLPRPRGAAALILAAFLVYTVGAFGVTFAFSVPLNESLAGVETLGSRADLAAARRAYVEPWVRWNVVRTVASTLAFLTLCGALYQTGREARRHAGQELPETHGTLRRMNWSHQPGAASQ